MRKIRAAAIATVLSVLGWPAASSACSCVPAPSTDQAVASAVEVVTGRVMGIALDSDENFARLAVRISGVFKGADDGFQTILVPRGLCGFPVELGAEYLFYIEELESGRRAVNSCGRSKKLATAAEDLAALGVPSKPRDADLQARARDAEAKSLETKRALAAMESATKFSEAVRLLRNLPGHRALAFLHVETRCAIWGFSYGYASLERAEARALTECQNQRGLRTDRSCALVPADGADSTKEDLPSCFINGPIEP